MDVAALLGWYRAHRRRLPWREEVSPYRTLVSELMLQQTRVETVIPYFERFMTDFPTVEALAAAPEERVLERWSGLGYYARARNLQAAARAVVARGGFPTDLEGLRALPGVGPYTAGAVASIALGLDAPVVDGNVERVLSRIFAWEKATKTQLWEAAAGALPPGEAGDYNQALMELGATLCTPKGARCLLCPLRSDCRGDPERHPAAKVKKEVPRAEAAAVALWRDGRLLLGRRPSPGLLAGLWELPTAEDPARALARVGLEGQAGPLLGEVRHVFTHLHLLTRVYAARAEGEAWPAGYPDLRWAPVEALDGMALSTLARKTLRLVLTRAARDG